MTEISHKKMLSNGYKKSTNMPADKRCCLIFNCMHQANLRNLQFL
jgi:hypothetical protein